MTLNTAETQATAQILEIDGDNLDRDLETWVKLKKANPKAIVLVINTRSNNGRLITFGGDALFVERTAGQPLWTGDRLIFDEEVESVTEMSITWAIAEQIKSLYAKSGLEVMIPDDDD
jgi:hypothetical protein